MSFVPHYVDSGFATNIFTPDRDNVSYISVNSRNSSDEYYYFFWYSSLVGKYVRTSVYYNEAFCYVDSQNRTWEMTNYGSGGYPVFSCYFNRATHYLYYVSGTAYIYTKFGYACGYTYQLLWDNEVNGIGQKQVYDDFFQCNSSSFQKTMNFTGYGSFQGQTLTFTAKIRGQVWVNTTSSSKPFGVYQPYSGALGESSVTGTKYLGNKYWTSSKVNGNNGKYILSPCFRDRSSSNTTRRYQITNIHWQYDSENEKHRWIIWLNNAHTRWYENNQAYPIQAQNYTYTYRSTDGSTGSNLTLTFGGYTGGDGTWTEPVYYFQPCRMV